MRKFSVRRRAKMTLLEIMIVIFIIGIISSVLGYNMKGSLEKAKAFKTREGMKKLGEIFDLEIAEGTSIDDIKNNPTDVLKRTGLVSDPKGLLQDGWGAPYEISLSKNGRELKFHSKNYEQFRRKMTQSKKEAKISEEDENGEEE